MEKTDQRYEVTGTLNPDVTGNYTPVGKYNNKPYYALDGNGWLIWWDGSVTWNISEVLGVLGTRGWENQIQTVFGEYLPYGTATGAATVAEI